MFVAVVAFGASPLASRSPGWSRRRRSRRSSSWRVTRRAARALHAPRRGPTRATTKAPTATRTKRPTERRLKEGRARASASPRGDSSTRRPNGLRDIRDAALRPRGRQGRAKREARRAASLTPEDRSARGPGWPSGRTLSRACGRFAASCARPGQGPSLRPRLCYEEMQRHLLGEEQLSTVATSARKWQKSLACAASMADVVCLRGLRCRRGSARRATRLLSLAAPGRSRSRWREGARGAALEHRSEARSAEVRAPVFAPVVPALQRRGGVADASAARWPGAALAPAAAGPRSAAREHRWRVRRRGRERRERPFSDRAKRAPHAPGGVGLTLLGRRASPQRASASGGDAPEARGACAK